MLKYRGRRGAQSAGVKVLAAFLEGNQEYLPKLKSACHFAQQFNFSVFQPKEIDKYAEIQAPRQSLQQFLKQKKLETTNISQTMRLFWYTVTSLPNILMLQICICCQGKIHSLKSYRVPTKFQQAIYKNVTYIYFFNICFIFMFISLERHVSEH